MITSEFEYHLIAELITMPDRELAQKIELHIWYRGPVPQPRILARYLKLFKDSTGPEEFRTMAADYIDKSGLEFIRHESGEFMCRTKAYNPPGYEEITVEQILKAEEQEPKE